METGENAQQIWEAPDKVNVMQHLSANTFRKEAINFHAITFWKWNRKANKKKVFRNVKSGKKTFVSVYAPLPALCLACLTYFGICTNKSNLCNHIYRICIAAFIRTPIFIRTTGIYINFILDHMYYPLILYLV